MGHSAGQQASAQISALQSAPLAHSPKGSFIRAGACQGYVPWALGLVQFRYLPRQLLLCSALLEICRAPFVDEELDLLLLVLHSRHPDVGASDAYSTRLVLVLVLVRLMV